MPFKSKKVLQLLRCCNTFSAVLYAKDRISVAYDTHAVLNLIFNKNNATV